MLLYGLVMDFQWVDIIKVPDYWRAIRGVLGEIKNVDIPGHEVRQHHWSEYLP